MSTKKVSKRAHAISGIGPRIKALREGLGLQGAEFARRAGITPQELNRAERTRTTPSVQTLARIARAGGTTVDALLGFVTSNPEAPNTADAPRPSVTRRMLVKRAKALADFTRIRLMGFARSDRVSLEDKLKVIDQLWPIQVEIVTRPAFTTPSDDDALVERVTEALDTAAAASR